MDLPHSHFNPHNPSHRPRRRRRSLLHLRTTVLLVLLLLSSFCPRFTPVTMAANDLLVFTVG